MKDAILKGTGDSRYLKSKIPTGTTWEQALAMLNAGTFPVDLNGINSEGFQQLGTPLNKANILKDAIVSKLGMTGDKTPNDMFGVLADCGNLHVWRKTVTTTEEVPAVPAGYTLGDKQEITAGSVNDSKTMRITFKYSSAISVSPEGECSLSETIETKTYAFEASGTGYTNFKTFLNGYMKSTFCQCSIDSGSYTDTVVYSDIFFITTDSVVTQVSNSSALRYEIHITNCQPVTPYPYTPAIPADTSVTYPVSTNRNAYQEGSNAQPAGYTLGDVVSGTLLPENNVSVPFYYSTSVSVSDDGTVSIPGTSSVVLSSMSLEDTSTLKGKYVSSDSRAGISGVWFIPSDASITKKYINNDGERSYLYCDKMQPVIGYPAIGGNIVDYVEKRTEATEARIILKEDFGSDPSYTVTFEVSDSIEFDDSGNPYLVDPEDLVLYFTIQSVYTITSTGGTYKGKYIKHKSNNKTTVTSFFPGDGNIGYVAEDAVTTVEQTSGTYKLTATITSRAYIISSTSVVHGETMDYLGCLGDKTRPQILSYVGTGAYGIDNPCSITASFPITQAYAINILNASVRCRDTVATSNLTTSYVSSKGFTSNDDYSYYGKKSADQKTIYWYTTSANSQLNQAGATYTFLVV